MIRVSDYLLPECRSLISVRDGVEAKIDELNERIEAWAAALLHANGDEHDTLGMAIDHASDEIARLEGRIDMLDDELGYRRSDDPGRPIVL